MLIDEVCDWLLPRVGSHRVADLRVGLGYTAVQLDDGRCGLAYTFREEVREGCCAIKEAGALTGRPAAELAEWAKSADAISAAVGLATLNAIIEPPAGAFEADLMETLPVGPDDIVGMVGYFTRLVDPLRSRAGALYVFERRPEDGSGLLPESATITLLPQCQIVILSATTLLNRTIDSLLDSCRSARDIAVLGPTTPLLPEVFSPRGVTFLSGIQVVDPVRVLRIISEGGGTRQLGRAVRKLTVHTPR
jgi:uncharacterized protein (DUF4213/DUF364 family)